MTDTDIETDESDSIMNPTYEQETAALEPEYMMLPQGLIDNPPEFTFRLLSSDLIGHDLDETLLNAVFRHAFDSLSHEAAFVLDRDEYRMFQKVLKRQSFVSSFIETFIETYRQFTKTRSAESNHLEALTSPYKGEWVVRIERSDKWNSYELDVKSRTSKGKNFILGRFANLFGVAKLAEELKLIVTFEPNEDN